MLGLGGVRHTNPTPASSLPCATVLFPYPCRVIPRFPCATERVDSPAGPVELLPIVDPPTTRSLRVPQTRRERLEVARELAVCTVFIQKTRPPASDSERPAKAQGTS